MKNGLRNKAFQKEGLEVVITMDEKDGKEVVTEIKLKGGKKKDK